MKIFKKTVSVLLSLVLALSVFAIVPMTASALSVNTEYIDEDGNQQTVSANVLTNVSTLAAGWYVADGILNFSDAVALTQYGNDKDVNIILTDSARIILNGFQGFYTDNEPVNLNIYSQTVNGGGIIESNASDFIALFAEGSSLNIYGGSLTASEELYASLISTGDIKISGGSVENAGVQSYDGAVTINGGTLNIPYIASSTAIYINGGSVITSEADCSDGEIVFNLTDTADSFYASNYYGTVRTENYLYDGSTVYEIGEITDTSQLESKTLRFAAHVHSFNAPVWTWKGFTSATAKFVCTGCAEEITATAEGDDITQNVVAEPTDSTTGQTVYTASVTVEGVEYTDQKTRTTHLGDHSYGSPQWTWDGYESAVLTMSCGVCGEIVTANAQISSRVTVEPTYTATGIRVYTATALIDGTEYTDSVTEVLPRLHREISVTYTNLNGSDKTVTASAICGDESKLVSGWYAVTNDVQLDYRLNCAGNVNLILCNGATYTVHKGIIVDSGASLTVWRQSKNENGTTLEGDQVVTLNEGKLIVDSPASDYPGIGTMISSVNFGEITINGGYLDIKGGNNAPALGGSDDDNCKVTINGGTVNAVAGSDCAGIGGCRNAEASITITGGEVTAYGNDTAPAIGGYKAEKCTIVISGGKVTAHGDEGSYWIKTYSIGIGSYRTDSCTVEITGGTVRAYTESSADEQIGIGSNDEESIEISFSWKRLDNCSIMADGYNSAGNISFVRSFVDAQDNVYHEGSEVKASNLAGRVLTPVCIDHTLNDEPAWTWEETSSAPTAYASFVCTKCNEIISKPATVSYVSETPFEIVYSASLSFDGHTYTDTHTFEKPLDIVVGGTVLTKDNCADVFGDGTVSYDVDTNTLTLNSATIEVAKYNKNTACGIRYDQQHTEPFKIVLIGNNQIVDEISDSVSAAKYGLMVSSCADELIVSGDGKLDVTLTGSESALTYYGIQSYTSVTFDGSEAGITIPGSAAVKGINLATYETVLSLKNSASLTIDVEGGSDSFGLGSGYVCENLSVESGSTFVSLAGAQACNDNIRPDQATKALGAAVNDVKSTENMSGWNGVTALGNYKAVIIPNDNAAPYNVYINMMVNGTVSVDKTRAMANDTVTVTVKADAGYHLEKLIVRRAGGEEELEVIDNKFKMPMFNVTIIAYFEQYAERVEPYIDENGEYHTGEVEHFISDGKNYAVNADGSMGEELSTTELSYFDFYELNDGTYQVKYYTGPTENLTELVIPKSYNGKAVTVLGVSSNDRFIQNTPKPRFTLVLNENITRIHQRSFYVAYVEKVTGDTSGLNNIGDYAFSWANDPDYTLDIKLDYQGIIYCGSGIFNNMHVTARIKHDTRFSTSNFQQQSINFIFTDEHPYGAPAWTWNDDNTAATAKFTCTDSRCKHTETVDATVSSGVSDGKSVITATAVLDGKTYTDVRETEVFAGHSISLGGDIGLNFFFDFTDDQITQGVTVNMQMILGENETKDISVNIGADNYDGKYGLYKAVFPVAAAEMNYNVTAAVTIGGEAVSEVKTFSVKEYADYILSNDYKTIYLGENHTEDEYAVLCDLVKAMLDYGAKAQTAFERTNVDLVNGGNDYFTYEVTDEMITAAVKAANANSVHSDMRADTSSFGLTYQGTSVIYLSKITLRHYYLVTDETKFTETVKNSANFTYGTKGKYIYFETTDIPAAEFDDLQEFYINGKAYLFSVLDYVSAAMKSGKISDEEKELVRASFRYNAAANEYFKPKEVTD